MHVHGHNHKTFEHVVGSTFFLALLFCLIALFCMLCSLSGGNSSRQQHFVKKVSCKEVVIGALHGPSSCDSAAHIFYHQLARVVRLASCLLCLDPVAYAASFHFFLILSSGIVFVIFR
jgi:hypothetical protein